jgi:hypothetical protein
MKQLLDFGGINIGGKKNDKNKTTLSWLERSR